MSTLLAVRAHPLDAGRSRTMRLLDTFLAAYRDAHTEDRVEELHLYDTAVPEIDIDLLSGWTKLREGEPFIHLHPSEQAKVTLFDKLGEQFEHADKIVIANPLWNLSVPTRLKAWIDTVCVAGKTFRYTPEGTAEGLVHGKKVLHVQTAGSHFDGHDPASQYVKGLFAFLGVTDFHQLFAEGMDHEPHRADEIMDEAARRAADLGRTF